MVRKQDSTPHKVAFASPSSWSMQKLMLILEYGVREWTSPMHGSSQAAAWYSDFHVEPRHALS
jgi:hypothetical protein